MLHCRGGLFYIGHTDDLERRIGEHRSGLIAGFTADHLPLELVWSESFQTRDDAQAAERKLKGWSRAKKLALIRGDWDRISALAKNKGGAWTSSAEAGEGAMGISDRSTWRDPLPSNSVRPELVEGLSFNLEPHPAALPAQASAITGSVRLLPHWLRLRWKVEDAGRVIVPPFAGKGRADGLWQRTCFELFLRAPGAQGYVELNLSPSEQWAAYDFTGYRAGMAGRAMPRDPECTVRRGGKVLIFDAAVPLAGLPPLPWDLGISAVIEEEGGVKSLWALRHAEGKADFHAPACFAARLAAPQGS